jgi:hypothetical protein
LIAISRSSAGGHVADRLAAGLAAVEVCLDLALSHGFQRVLDDRGQLVVGRRRPVSHSRLTVKMRDVS